MTTVDVATPDLADTRWRRRPFRSLVVRNLRLLAGGAALLLGVLRDRVEDVVTGEPLDWSVSGVVAAGALGLLVVVAVANAVEWAHFRYCVTDAGLHTRTGAFSTTLATFPPSRIDGVGLDEPFLQRIAGLATLKVEVSGGVGSGTEISGIPRDQAEQMLGELLALREDAAPSGLPHEDSEDVSPLEHGAAGDSAAIVQPQPQPEPVLTMDAGRGTSYTLRSPMLWVLAIAAVGLLTAGVIRWSTDTFASAFQLLLFAVAAGGAAVRTAAARWREVSTWTVGIDERGVVVQRGRLHRSRTTIRATKVSAIVLRQGPVLRRSGWWNVQVAVSALGSGADEGSRATVCAAATTEEVAWLLPHLMPTLSPGTAAELVAAMQRRDPLPHWLGSQPWGRWFDPLGWRFTGVSVTDLHMLTRVGRFARRLQVIDRERIQQTRVQAGPLERRGGVASLEVVLAPGPTSTVVPYLRADIAARLMNEVALDRSRRPAA